MGFLSSLFGYEDKPATTTRVATVPPELKPYVEEVLTDTQELYKKRMEEGYTPYTGDTIAGLTPEQVASQEGLKSLVGTQVPFQQEALGIFREGAERFTPETAKEFMSPYQRAVIDQEKEQAQRQYERTKRPMFEADAVKAGGMSGLGSRAAIESAERDDLQARFLGDIETRGLQAAYKDAQNQFTQQKARERTVGTDVATAGGNIFSAGIAEQGLLKGIGEEKQGLAQSALDESYLKYVQEREYPEQQLARYQSSIYGNPLLTSRNNFSQQSTQPQASRGKSLLGLGMTGLKAYGAGGGFGSGGFNWGNAVKSIGNTGGQVGGLPTLYRENGGGLTSIEEARKKIAEELAPRRAAATEGERISLERQLPSASPGKAERIREELAKLGPRPVAVKTQSKTINKEAAPAVVVPEKKAPPELTGLEKLKAELIETDKGKQIIMSEDERNRRIREQNAIMNEALASRKTRSAGDVMDSFFAGLLAPEGTPASGYERVVADEQKREEKIEALEDASTVKEANQLIENKIATYPEEVQIRLRAEIQKIYNSNLASQKKVAAINKLIFEASGGSKRKPTELKEMKDLKALKKIVTGNKKVEEIVDKLFDKDMISEVDFYNRVNKRYIDGQNTNTDYTTAQAIKDVLQTFVKKKNK